MQVHKLHTMFGIQVVKHPTPTPAVTYILRARRWNDPTHKLFPAGVTSGTLAPFTTRRRRRRNLVLVSVFALMMIMVGMIGRLLAAV